MKDSENIAIRKKEGLDRFLRFQLEMSELNAGGLQFNLILLALVFILSKMV